MSELARTIAAQDEAVSEMLSVDLDAAAERLAPARRIWLVGTGTSQHAAELGAMMFARGERTVRWASGASFAWIDAPLGPEDGVVVISHTTETAFAGAARARALAAGARLVSITARGGPWPEAVQTIDRERAETYTASYFAALVVLARLTLALEQSILERRDIDALPDAVRDAIGRGAPPVPAPERLLALAGVG
ncbi:MAG: SIS domain-containing protein, partial [Solirubrobacteraceae bacterium]